MQTKVHQETISKVQHCQERFFSATETLKMAV
jgi:hypothetical protein